jgi:predicted dehydrogenase
MSRICIGQIGMTHEHAAGKIAALRQMSDVYDLVGVVDDRDSTAARFIGDDFTPYDGLRRMTEVELLNTPDLQAVMIETANTDLVPTAIRCMRRGLAMHMDKPGGEDMSAFGELLSGCKKRRLPFQMGYMFRNNPAIQFCQKIVRENGLGDIFEIHANMSHNYGDEAYRRYLARFRGGIMFNLGCHLIDTIVAMLGRPEGVTPFLHSTESCCDAAKDNGLAVLEYPHAIAMIHACSSEIDGLPRRRLKVCGTKGTIELCPLERFDGQPLQLHLTLSQAHGEYKAGNTVVDFGVQTDRYRDQLSELATIIRGDIANPYTYDHDAIVQQVVLAASGYVPWTR